MYYFFLTENNENVEGHVYWPLVHSIFTVQCIQYTENIYGNTFHRNVK